jgi:hypothetical protein
VHSLITHILLTTKNLSFLNTHKNIFFAIISAIIFLISKNNGISLENVLFASKTGNQLCAHSIFNWTIPNSFDPDHIPFLGFLLAIFWEIFGRKLWGSHLLMLPFIIGLFYQLYDFVKHCIQRTYIVFLGFLMIIADPNLAKLPRNSLRFKAVDCLTKKKIEIESILSSHSNNRALKYIDFKNDKRAF